MQLEEAGEPKLICKNRHQSIWIELEHSMQKLHLTMALHRLVTVQQECRIEIVLWLRGDLDLRVDGPMV